jgi:diketogulonate reductase-like aldo/keto reductase
MSIKLNNGFDMPALGFGTFLMKDADAFYRALKNGYTHFDTATIYGNEQFIGEAIERGIQEGLCKRENLFIATKLWHSDYADPEAALRLSLDKLKTDYVDLYMIHWPYTGLGPVRVPMHVLWR